MKITRGAVVVIQLDPTIGHEQGGRRPCVVVTPSELAAEQRYPVIVIVPLTTWMGGGPLYPVIQPYPRGLNKPSTVLVDQVRAIDKRRVVSELAAPIPTHEMKRVDDALRKTLGL